MEQQPPKSDDGPDRQRDEGGRSGAEEPFVVEPEPPRRLRRWLSTEEDYQPRQFDLDKLPDEAGEATAGSTPAAPTETDPPVGHASAARPVRRKSVRRPAEQPPAPPASHDETPPLGFVSEPRPVAPDDPQTADTQLGFVNRAQASNPESAEPPSSPPGQAPDADVVPEKPAPEEEQPPEIDAEQTPGQMLQQAREQQGLSAEDIALKTRMPLETVLALEEDRDPEQSAWVYVRGFYRRYARALNIPDAPLLEAHARMAGTQQPESQPLASEWAPQDVSPAPSMQPKMLFVLVTSVVLGVTAWWFGPKVGAYIEDMNLSQKASSAYGGMKAAAVTAGNKSSEVMGSAAEKLKSQTAAVAGKASEKYNSAAEKVKTETSPLLEAARAQRETVRQRSAGTAPQPEPVPSAPVEETAAETETAAVSAAPAQDSGDQGLAQAQPEPEPQAPPAEPMLEPEAAGPLDMAAAESEDGSTAADAAAVLELEFSRQSWLSVADGNGVVLFEDMVEGGTTKRFDGEPPLTLFLGTATAANARFNGQPVNIASQMRSNGTARILLGE